MRILITGASGFIGSHLLSALLAQGHEVLAGTRHPAGLPDIPGLTPLAIDFARQTAPADWLRHLRGVDAVVNCAGIIAENRRNRFKDVHYLAPAALFEACAEAGVRKVIQISALGADQTAFSHYHLSKRAADDHLAALDLDWAILQPSLVYGQGGQSTALLGALAALPIVPLVGDGRQMLQPVHVDDLVAAILKLLEPDAPTRMRLPVVGLRPLMLRQFLAALRRWLGLKPAVMVSVPYRWMLAAAKLTGRLVPSPLNDEALRMLQRGNTGDPAAFTLLLGRQPLALERALALHPTRQPERRHARLYFLLPALRITLALLWIWSGLASAFLAPIDDSLSWLAAAGITGVAAPLVLYGAAALDALLGGALLINHRTKWVGLIQILLMLAYSLVVGIFLPEFLLHPFAPVVKNIPLIVATLMVMAVDER
jgi:uncharacterized protein YbjT (DUF2867 family)